eukprot:g82714.t1
MGLETLCDSNRHLTFGVWNSLGLSYGACVVIFRVEALDGLGLPGYKSVSQPVGMLKILVKVDILIPCWTPPTKFVGWFCWLLTRWHRESWPSDKFHLVVFMLPEMEKRVNMQVSFDSEDTSNKYGCIFRSESKAATFPGGLSSKSVLI